MEGSWEVCLFVYYGEVFISCLHDLLNRPRPLDKWHCRGDCIIGGVLPGKVRIRTVLGLSRYTGQDELAAFLVLVSHSLNKVSAFIWVGFKM